MLLQHSGNFKCNVSHILCCIKNQKNYFLYYLKNKTATNSNNVISLSVTRVLHIRNISLGTVKNSQKERYS